MTLGDHLPCEGGGGLLGDDNGALHIFLYHPVVEPVRGGGGRVGIGQRGPGPPPLDPSTLNPGLNQLWGGTTQRTQTAKTKH